MVGAHFLQKGNRSLWLLLVRWFKEAVNFFMRRISNSGWTVLEPRELQNLVFFPHEHLNFSEMKLYVVIFRHLLPHQCSTDTDDDEDNRT